MQFKIKIMVAVLSNQGFACLAGCRNSLQHGQPTLCWQLNYQPLRQMIQITECCFEAFKCHNRECRYVMPTPEEQSAALPYEFVRWLAEERQVNERTQYLTLCAMSTVSASGRRA